MSKKEYTLKAETEVRFVLSENESISLQILEGNAEIFGIEMALNRLYNFNDENIAVYTWYGCKLEMTGNCQSSYVSNETPMISYVNTHAQLEAKRDVALANSENGPRVMVVGRTDSGKSTLSRILSSYAVRLDRTPIFIDTDIGQGAVSLPGTICAVPLDKSSLSIEEGFSLVTPLVYFHGHTTPKDNLELFKHILTNVAHNVNQRLEKDVDARSSGLIVNTCGWVDGAGYDLLLQAISTFGIDVILVMGDERLYFALTAAVQENVTVVKLTRSGGVVERDSLARRRGRKNKISEYFYGYRVAPGITPRLSPCRTDMKLGSVKLLRAGGLQLSEAMLPIGHSATHEPVKYISVAPSQELLHSILAVLHSPIDEDGMDGFTGKDSGSATNTSDIPVDLPQANVAGFLYVVELDLESDTMVVLTPTPGALPSKYLLMGSLKWVE